MRRTTVHSPSAAVWSVVVAMLTLGCDERDRAAVFVVHPFAGSAIGGARIDLRKTDSVRSTWYVSGSDGVSQEIALDAGECVLVDGGIFCLTSYDPRTRTAVLTEAYRRSGTVMRRVER